MFYFVNLQGMLQIRYNRVAISWKIVFISDKFLVNTFYILLHKILQTASLNVAITVIYSLAQFAFQASFFFIIQIEYEVGIRNLDKLNIYFCLAILGA